MLSGAPGGREDAGSTGRDGPLDMRNQCREPLKEAWCLLHGKDGKMEICERFLRDEPVWGPAATRRRGHWFG